jgi:amidase
VNHLTRAGARPRASEGPVDGPFRGVPFVTKDLVGKEAGLPFHEGNVHLKEIGYTAEEDQEYVVRTRRAGLISLGRTNVPEFGIRPVCEPLAYGPTNNPWNLTRSPGGSTGGGAAAVAAGIVPLAHANDAGGSIRAPASHNGLVGLKPSRRRSSLAPDFFDFMGGLAEELVITRSVRDTALALAALASIPHVGDWHPTWPAADSYVSEAERDPGQLRIGFGVDHPAVPTHEHVAATVETVAAMMDRLGHAVERSLPTAFDEDLAPLLLPHYARARRAPPLVSHGGSRAATLGPSSALCWLARLNATVPSGAPTSIAPDAI